MRRILVGLALLVLGMVPVARAETIGSVDTVFKLIGPNHKVVIEVFDDPSVQGVSCYISRAITGGIMGGIGLATDPSDASVACRQVGDTISFTKDITVKETVFSEKASILFKKVQVVRMVDPARNVLIYLVYSDKLIDGSPKNSITAVPVPTSIKIPLKK